MINLPTARMRLCTALLLAACILPSAAFAAASPLATRGAVDRAIDRMRPSLVRIHVVSTDYSEGREVKTQSVGSGAILTEDGFLITNHHVAGHAATLLCTLSTREQIPADLVGTDPLTDIAVLKLRPRSPRKFVPARFGDSSRLRVGDSVLAMGSPMALSQSVTLGIISNVEMIMPRFYSERGALRLDGEDVGSLVRWIGHDAAIYGGNSGGPLINLKGEIIGINELQFGLSGAIPGNLAREISSQLIAHRKVTRSWLGLDVQPRFKNSTHNTGAIISGVIKNSPADEAAIRPGDILLLVNGAAVDAQYDEQMPELMRRLTGLPLSQKVDLTLLRDGAELKKSLTPVERGQLRPKQREFREWGITAGDLTPMLAREMKQASTRGVLVTSVRAGGPAGDAKPPLSPRDVLVELDGQPLRDGAHLAELTARILTNRADTATVPVLAAYERQSRRYLTVVRIGLTELRAPGMEVKKAWLPVETQVISRDIARERNTPNLKGVYITQVYPKTSAEKAGLQPGDFITAVDGTKLDSSAMEHQDEFASLLRQYDVDTQVTLTILRGTNELKTPVALEMSPRPRREMKKYRDVNFEFTAREIAFVDIAEERWSLDQKGAIVEDVKTGGWADLGELRTDDVILAIGDREVDGVDSIKDILRQLATEKRRFIIVKVLRGIHTIFLELEPAWKTQ